MKLMKRAFNCIGLLALAITLSSCSSEPSNCCDTVPPPPTNPPGVGSFSISDSKIIDPSGAEFIGKGVNVNGPNWPWSRLTVPDLSLISDNWNCNIVRLNCWAQNPPYVNPANSNMAPIITAFTAKKIVVMVEDHSFTGTYPNAAQLTTSINWWTTIANQYKDNPYVWFNLMNEPGSGSTIPHTWLEVHEAIIKAIRDAGATNIIVCDEHGFGQASGYQYNEANSAALTYGPTLTAKYSNLLFSLHLYDGWIYGRDRLDHYVNAMQTKKLALIIGEYGVGSNYSASVAADIFKVALTKKIGRIAWHWAGDDIHKLTTTGGGYTIDNTSGGKPGNLSFAGNLVWLDNHGLLTATDPALEPPSILVSNLNFEAGEPSANASSIEGWINFGTARLDNEPANVKEGSFAVRINSGAAGGCGQGIYLQPGASYRLTAWGKTSQSLANPSTISLKYTNNAGVEASLASLEFSSINYLEKSVSFQLPAQVASVFLVVYKNDVGSSFLCDDIRLEKL